VATVDDLYDALEQLACRGETSPGDAQTAVADARRAAEERHKSSLGLWRAIAAAAAVVLLVAAVVAVRDRRDTVTITDVPTSSLLDGDRRGTVTTTDVPASSLLVGEASDAFDRGRNETLVLDPDTEERLRGVVVASLDGEADAAAVAAPAVRVPTTSIPDVTTTPEATTTIAVDLNAFSSISFSSCSSCGFSRSCS
jgi:hypothetical protein